MLGMMLCFAVARVVGSWAVNTFLPKDTHFMVYKSCRIMADFHVHRRFGHGCWVGGWPWLPLWDSARESVESSDGLYRGPTADLYGAVSVAFAWCSLNGCPHSVFALTSPGSLYMSFFTLFCQWSMYVLFLVQ